MSDPIKDDDDIQTARAVLIENGTVDYPRPWLMHAARAVAKETCYADYAGFCDWMTDQFGPEFMENLEVAWDEMGELGRIALYSILSESKGWTFDE